MARAPVTARSRSTRDTADRDDLASRDPLDVVADARHRRDDAASADVVALFAAVFDLPRLDPDSDVAALGLDKLDVMYLWEATSEEYSDLDPVEVDLNAALDARRVADLADVFVAALSTTSRRDAEPGDAPHCGQ